MILIFANRDTQNKSIPAWHRERGSSHRRFSPSYSGKLSSLRWVFVKSKS